MVPSIQAFTILFPILIYLKYFIEGTPNRFILFCTRTASLGRNAKLKIIQPLQTTVLLSGRQPVRGLSKLKKLTTLPTQ